MASKKLKEDSSENACDQTQESNEACKLEKEEIEELRNILENALRNNFDYKGSSPILEKLKVQENQSFSGELHDFDPDLSPIAWKYYMMNYPLLHNVNAKLYREKNRLISEIPLDIKGSTTSKSRYEIGGDCTFNFNEKKIEKFTNAIKKLRNKNKLSIGTVECLNNKLEICKAMHHSVLNFDLMPRTGGLNNIKGKLKYKDGGILVHGTGRMPDFDCFDRPDTFLYLVNDAYTKKEDVNKGEITDLGEIGEFFSDSIFNYSFKTENFKSLYQLIDEVKSFDNYCKRFYNIDDKKMIKKFLERGKKKIVITREDETDNEVITLNEYMNLAIEYWLYKLEKLKKKKLDLK